MREIDARRLPCPQPTILVKNEIEKGEQDITVLVDNDIACENVSRLAKRMNYSVAVDTRPDGFCLLLKSDSKEAACPVRGSNIAYFIKTDSIGTGDDELGVILMKAFVYALTQLRPAPTHMVLMNSGVRLAVEGSEHKENLQGLAEYGCAILVCGTCLDFYGLKEKLAVGIISNMYDILEALSASENVISI